MTNQANKTQSHQEEAATLSEAILHDDSLSQDDKEDRMIDLCSLYSLEDLDGISELDLEELASTLSVVAEAMDQAPSVIFGALDRCRARGAFGIGEYWRGMSDQEQADFVVWMKNEDLWDEILEEGGSPFDCFSTIVRTVNYNQTSRHDSYGV